MKPTTIAFAAVLLALGCQDPVTSRFQGAAHYDGKRFRDLEGHFAGLALAPAGDRVAFMGGGDAQGQPGALYVADVDGLTRRVTPAEASVDPIVWAADGRSVFFRGYLQQADGMVTGLAIRQFAFGDQAPRQAVAGLPHGPFVSAPDGSRLIVGTGPAGAPPTLDRPRNRMIDVATGASADVAPGVRPFAGTWAAAWSPSGAHVALASLKGESTGMPVEVRVLGAPGWKPGEAPALPAGPELTAMAWESDQALRVAEVLPGEALVVTRVGTSGQVLGTTRAALDLPAAGFRHLYYRPVPSRDGRRVLVSRHLLDDGLGGSSGPRAHAVFDDAGRHALEVHEDLDPVGWLDDRRILFMSGLERWRRPVVVEVPS